METPKQTVMAVHSESLEDLELAGVIVNVDPEAAEYLGAFEEDALSAADAWESNSDPRQEP